MIKLCFCFFLFFSLSHNVFDRQINLVPPSPAPSLACSDIRDMSMSTTQSYGGCVKGVRIEEENRVWTDKNAKMNLAMETRNIRGEVSLSTCYTT